MRRSRWGERVDAAGILPELSDILVPEIPDETTFCDGEDVSCYEQLPHGYR